MVKIKNLNLEVYGIIYLIRNKINGKCYVGQTQKEKGFNGRYYHSGEGIERVYKHHKLIKERSGYYNKHLLHSIEKYGFEAFEINKCLDYAFSLEELNIKEKVYIQLYNSFKNGYNETLGGEGVEGHIPTEETRQRMSEANKGENNHMYGKHHTEEVKEKISEARKGKLHTEEAKQKIGEARKGKHHSEETRQKISSANKGEKHPMHGKHHSEETKQRMSEARKGENHPNYGKHLTKEVRQRMSEARKGKYVGEKHPRAKAVYCYEKNEIRLTIKEWVDELNLNKACVIWCCKGKLKSTGGYHFRYATKEEIEEYKQKNKNY